MNKEKKFKNKIEAINKRNKAINTVLPEILRYLKKIMGNNF